MKPQVTYIQENKSALFDWLVFGISVSLGFIFPTLGSFVYSAGFSYWMLAAMVLYIAGAGLKHRPIRYRLMKSGQTLEPVPLLLFILAGHWVIFLMVVIFSETAFRHIVGLPIPPPEKQGGGIIILYGMLIPTFITWLVFRSKSGLKKAKPFSDGYLFRRELVADIFLVSAVSILSFAFWEKGIMAMLLSSTVNSISDVWFKFIFLSMSYVLFYIPLRYLFLIEDHFSRQTWRRLLLIFGLLLLRSLFEMIRI